MRGEREEKAWEKAGWTRAPRNGREKKLLRAGKPQPKEREAKPFRCRRFGHTTYKTVWQDGREVRACTTCRRGTAKAWRKNNPVSAQKSTEKHREKLRTQVPEKIDGVYTVSFSWVLTRGAVGLSELLADGEVVIENFGLPMCLCRRV